MKLISDIIWIIAISLIITISIYLSFKLSFPQFKIGLILKSTFLNENGKNPFKGVLLTLGSRIGVGSIAGVALAIKLGGIGSILWLWVSAILGSVITYSETYLAMKYRIKKNGIYCGGPFYYISLGLKNNPLARFYSVMIVISFLVGFAPIQANTIINSISYITNTNKYILGIIICIIIIIIIKSSLEKTINFIIKLVPFMILFYIVISIAIVFLNIKSIPSILINILKEGLNFKSFLSSFIPSLVIGLQRGIFSSEAGLGTGSISSSSIDYDDYKKCSYAQILGIYITSLVICTLTALVIILSKYSLNEFINPNGIEIVLYAFNNFLGNFGTYFIFISICLFSLATVLTGYYDSSISLKYLFKSDVQTIFKFITILCLYIGSIFPPYNLWNFVDIVVGILSIINVYSIIKLKNEIEI